MRTLDVNDMAHWFPPLEAAGLPVPRTVLVPYDGDDLSLLLDGRRPRAWVELVDGLRHAGAVVGWPMFLRTGHGSGKHEWERTCHVPSAAEVPARVAALVEWSALADLMGLPTRTWAAREMLDGDVLCRCAAYGGMPVVREFRLFVRDDAVEHLQPYWPEDAVAAGRPDDPAWRWRLGQAARLAPRTTEALRNLALRAVDAQGGGFWSVDLFRARRGWFVTDMAEGDRSFRYEP